ncbi:MAG: hypothetical protein ABEJ68_00345 [Halobacteriaceae archaeon]
MVADRVIAALAVALVTASFPFYLYGAWIIVDAETVTWDVLLHHLRYIVVGLALTTGPVVFWMLPRLSYRLNGVTGVHAFFGLQAYAMLTFALTGIVRIFQVKRRHDLYSDPEADVDLDDLHENMTDWRRRLRVGVAGYVVLWLIAWVVGMAYFLLRYL